MSLRAWLVSIFRGAPEQDEPDPVKDDLTARQAKVADRLARMRGQTRDQVLAEAYRRADRTLAKHR